MLYNLAARKKATQNGHHGFPRAPGLPEGHAEMFAMGSRGPLVCFVAHLRAVVTLFTITYGLRRCDGVRVEVHLRRHLRAFCIVKTVTSCTNNKNINVRGGVLCGAPPCRRHIIYNHLWASEVRGDSGLYNTKLGSPSTSAPPRGQQEKEGQQDKERAQLQPQNFSAIFVPSPFV